MSVSVVIPTLGRTDALRRLLRSLEAQTVPPDEIIIVTPDESFGAEGARLHAGRLPVRILFSERSLCVQRNRGVQSATCDYIFLCDDDMEPVPEYIGRMTRFLAEHADRAIVTGCVLELRGGAWREDAAIGYARLIWNSVFLLSVWTDVGAFQGPRMLRPLTSLLKKYYRKKGNTQTAAGWPLVTSPRNEAFMTRFYGLGAAVVRRSALGASPFDETLDAHGIGDHYAFLAARREPFPVTVLPDTPVRHHHDLSGRLPDHLSYFRRLLVLHAVRRRHASGPEGVLAFCWSLLGNFVPFLLRGRWKHALMTARAITRVLFGRQPN